MKEEARGCNGFDRRKQSGRFRSVRLLAPCVQHNGRQATARRHCCKTLVLHTKSCILVSCSQRQMARFQQASWVRYSWEHDQETAAGSDLLRQCRGFTARDSEKVLVKGMKECSKKRCRLAGMRHWVSE